MKRISITIVAILTASNTAFADGLSAPLPESEPVVVENAASGADWSGIYGGVTFGRLSGDLSDSFAPYDYEPETVPGAFFGYNFQRGRIVFGGELGYSNNSMLIIADGDDFLNPVFDLRGRVGYSVGRRLVYGFVGYSRATMTVNGIVDNAIMIGANYGVGIDLTFGKKLFVGLDYSIRNMNGTATSGNFDIDTDVKNLGIRVGMAF